MSHMKVKITEYFCLASFFLYICCRSSIARVYSTSGDKIMPRIAIYLSLIFILVPLSYSACACMKYAIYIHEGDSSKVLKRAIFSLVILLLVTGLLSF